MLTESRPANPRTERDPVELLRRLFGSSRSGSITPKELLDLAGRSAKSRSANAGWLHNTIGPLRRLGLVEPVYGNSGARGTVRLEKYALTGKGSGALDRLQADDRGEITPP